MRKFGLICFNIAAAVAGATVYAWAVRRDGFTEPAWTRALIEGGSVGFLSGAAVGLGATLGPRPSLPVRKCILALLGIAVTSLMGALVSHFFPREYGMAAGMIDEAFAERGVLRGSAAGMIVGTAFQVVQIYFKRRRPRQ